VTGLTHDVRGYPVMTADAQSEMLSRLVEKVHSNRSNIVPTESYRMKDAEFTIVSYGVSARSSLAAVDEARAPRQSRPACSG